METGAVMSEDVRKTPMTPRRCVCGWCPMQLPDNHDDWYLHFLAEHGVAGGFSVRLYEARSIEQELAELERCADGQP